MVEKEVVEGQHNSHYELWVSYQSECVSCYHFVLGYAATVVVAVGYVEVGGDDLRECCCGHFGGVWMVHALPLQRDDVMI
jgi:hypothetical protein